MARVVVVGAGLGGLAAAARLAAGGHAVTIVEQADDVGGKLGWYARDGHAFDTGPSLVTLPHLFDELFSATGAPFAVTGPGEDGVVMDASCIERCSITEHGSNIERRSI